MLWQPCRWSKAWVLPEARGGEDRHVCCARHKHEKSYNMEYVYCSGLRTVFPGSPTEVPHADATTIGVIFIVHKAP